MPGSKRRALVLGLVLAHAGAGAHAQGGFASRPIRMVVPFTPGGALDTVARAVAPIAGERLGTSVVIDNKPGGNTAIGSDIVAQAAPDGRTLLFAPAPIAFNTALGLKLPYDPLKDFSYITLVARIPGILIVNPQLPVKTVRELVEYAKREAAEKGTFQYATAGVGTMGHMLGERLFIEQGVKPQHIGYKGSAPALQDLVGGQVRVIIDAYIPSGPQVIAGRARALAIASSRRSPVLPDVPTFAEAGYPDLEAFGFYGVMAPAGTSKAVVDRLNAAFVAAAGDRQVRAGLIASGYEVIASTPEGYRDFVKQQIAIWTPVVKKADIRVEQ